MSTALEAAQKAATEAALKNQAVATDPEIVKSKTYYNRIGGSTYYFKDGTCALFIGGAYDTDKKHEQEELNALVKHPGNHHVCDVPVPVQNPNDSVILKDVGGSGGTGMVTSAALAALAQRR
jgi:hypothetical protein